MTTMTNTETPRVWVGCLGCYNAGTLTGRWFDATEAPESAEEFDEALGFPGTASNQVRVIDGVPFSADHGHPVYGPHEELWVMDHENFRGLLTGECSPSHAKRLAEKLEEVGDNPAFDAWLTTTSLAEYSGDVDALIAAFEDAVYSQGDSERDAAYEWLNETCAFEGLPEMWANYEWHLAGIWADDKENGGEIRFVRHDGQTYMFFH